MLTRVNVTLMDLRPVHIESAFSADRVRLKCGTAVLNKFAICDSAEVRIKTARFPEKIWRGSNGYDPGKRCKSVIAREPAA